MKHLQQLAPDMFKLIERADDSRLKKVCALVCEFSISGNRPFEPVVDEALECLRLDIRYGQELIDRLEALMNRLDDQYFELKERAEEMEDVVGRQRLISQYRALFQKARAVAALRAASDPDGFEAATESIYEAAASVPDREVVFDLVVRLLGA